MSVAHAGGATRPAVLRLMLTDFRGYAAARLEVDERPVVLTGPNGAGKTNLLEAISFLAPGRGLRRARLAEIDRRVPPAPLGGAAPGAWRVAATAGDAARPACRSAPAATPRARAASAGILRIDGAPRQDPGGARRASQPDLAHAADGSALPGGERGRGAASSTAWCYGFDPGHAARVSAYEQAMRERARLLRDGPLGCRPGSARSRSAWRARHRRRGGAARRDCAPRYRLPRQRRTLPGGRARRSPARSSNGSRRCRRSPPRPSCVGGSQAARRIDAESGVTTAGPASRRSRRPPCRERRLAAQCSTGEQKALLVAVAAGASAAAGERARGGAADAARRSDGASRRRSAAPRSSASSWRLGVQAWLTGTERALFAELDGAAQFFGVASGAIAPQ